MTYIERINKELKQERKLNKINEKYTHITNKQTK